MIVEIVLIGIIALLLFALFVSLGYGVHIYNYLQIGLQNIRTQFSNIKTEYQRRWDLYMNLAESVKAYNKHERFIQTEVPKARSMMNFSGSQAQQFKTMGSLDKFFSKLAVVVEAYPELKASKQHRMLMDEIRITEDRINIARTDFNDLVRDYNITVVSFPSSMIAQMFKFVKEEFYVNEEVSNKAPKIEL